MLLLTLITNIFKSTTKRDPTGPAMRRLDVAHVLHNSTLKEQNALLKRSIFAHGRRPFCTAWKSAISLRPWRCTANLEGRNSDYTRRPQRMKTWSRSGINSNEKLNSAILIPIELLPLYSISSVHSQPRPGNGHLNNRTLSTSPLCQQTGAKYSSWLSSL